MSDFQNIALIDPIDAQAKLKALQDSNELLSTLTNALVEAQTLYGTMDKVGVLGTEVANTIGEIIPHIKPIAAAMQIAADNAAAACKSAEAQLAAVGQI